MDGDGKRRRELIKKGGEWLEVRKDWWWPVDVENS